MIRHTLALSPVRLMRWYFKFLPVVLSISDICKFRRVWYAWLQNPICICCLWLLCCCLMRWVCCSLPQPVCLGIPSTLEFLLIIVVIVAYTSGSTCTLSSLLSLSVNVVNAWDCARITHQHGSAKQSAQYVTFVKFFNYGCCSWVEYKSSVIFVVFEWLNSIICL